MRLAWAERQQLVSVRAGQRCEYCRLYQELQGAVFHPRQDQWTAHFAWQGYEIVGVTPIGRALIDAFTLNHPRRLRVRQVEERFGVFPPPKQ